MKKKLVIAFLSVPFIYGCYVALTVNPHSLSWFIASYFNFFLALFVYWKNPDDRVSRSFVLLGLTVALWTLNIFGLCIVPDENMARWWSRGCIVTMFLPAAYVNFFVTFTGHRRSRMVVAAATALSAVFALLDAAGLLLPYWERFSWKFVPRSVPLYQAFLLFSAFCFAYGLLLVVSELRRKVHTMRVRNQYKYVLLAFGIGAVFGFSNALLTFRMKIYPLGSAGTMLFTSIIAYAIVKHQLLDIQVIIRKSLVYAMLTASLVGIYMLVVGFLTILVGKGALHSGSIMANGLTGLVMAMVFLPLHTRVQYIVDRLFFKDKYDYQKTLRNFSDDLTSIIEPDVLVETMVEKVTQAMHIERGYMLLLSRGEDRFVAKALRGMDAVMEGTELEKDHPTLRFLTGKKGIVQVEESQDILCPFREQGIQVLVPLVTKNRLLAVCCLGGKRSEDAYTSEDLRLLATIANQAAVAIENAQLSLSMRVLEKNLLQSDKMAALGALASSVAHEIKNPLVSVKTFCQLVGRKFSDQAFVGKFNDVVPREIERLEHVLSRLLDFSKRSDLNLTAVKMERILEDLLVLLHYEAFKNNVKIIRRYDETSPAVLAAGEEIRQVFMNMVLNAIQSMPRGGTLTISTGKVLEDGREKTLVSFKDSGIGIPAANLEKLFVPFFSTRENGTGLGLFITKRIIREYNGTITVESREGQGTTFTIKLPGSNSSL